VDTPDDDVRPAEPDGDAFDPPELAAYDEEPVVAPAGRGAKGWLLAILAGVAVVAVGVAGWGLLDTVATRDFVGISVLIGLLVGYVVRELSGRTSLGARLVAVLITAVGCVAGATVGETAYTAATYKVKFWDLLPEVDVWRLMTHRPAVHYAVYVVALVIAFLAAGPQKPKTKPAPEDAEPAEEPLGEEPTGEDVTG
jgi:hypothetical protein